MILCKNVFLHGNLEKYIYKNFSIFTKEVGVDKVCKLKKVFCSLMQSPRTWFGRFARVMLAIGYKQSRENAPYLPSI